MLPYITYQQKKVLQFKHLKPVLNGGCKENPANLALETGDVNFDLQDFDSQEGISLYSVPNFIQGSLLDIPLADARFGIVVVAEVLEHCSVAAAGKIFTEVHRVLRDDGVFILTFPWDKRAPEAQHAKHLLITWTEGINSWHSTVWLPELFDPLVKDGKFRELTEHREILDYGHCQGVGTVLAKA